MTMGERERESWRSSVHRELAIYFERVRERELEMMRSQRVGNILSAWILGRERGLLIFVVGVVVVVVVLLLVVLVVIVFILVVVVVGKRLCKDDTKCV